MAVLRAMPAHLRAEPVDRPRGGRSAYTWPLETPRAKHVVNHWDGALVAFIR